jgi:hypothetical protein
VRKALTLADFKKQASGVDGANLADAVKLFKVNPQIVRADGGDAVASEDGGLIRVTNITSSDSSVDREDDTIRAAGWKLSNFHRNPVILWGHNSRVPPVARATRTEIIGDKLQQDFEFTPADLQHPMGMGFGHAVGRMFKEGFLNAVSVGFSPHLWQFNEERGGIDFLEQELLETSPVTIPANANALADAGKRLADDGVDLAPVYEWAERCLDGDDGMTLIVPRKSIELTHSLLGKTLGKAERVYVDMGTKSDDDKHAPDASAPSVKSDDGSVVADGGDVSIQDAAKAAAESRGKVEADALKSVNDAADAIEALGGATDKESFASAFKRFAKLGLLTIAEPPAELDADAPSPTVGDGERTITIIADKSQIQVSQKDLNSLFDRVGKTTQETIAQLTGRLTH